MAYAYDLLYVTIGDEQVGARPIEWDREDVTGDGRDSFGEPIETITWMTTCPACSDLINITKQELYVATDGTEFCAKCPSCETGRELKKPQYSKGPERKASPDVAVFVDPIREGLFDHEVDHDLLVRLDEELVKLF